MGIRNIDDLKNPAVDPDAPTAPPAEDNTQAGTPATPIDNVAQEQTESEGDSDE